MKKFGIILGLAALVLMAGCNKVRRNPGRAYMPDMAYSRAYETYASTEHLKAQGVNYNAMPVPGTVARGDQFPYTLANDSAGYEASKAVKNPLPALGQGPGGVEGHGGLAHPALLVDEGDDFAAPRT